ncbi:MAG: DNA (cytosine-5-)-methyltransferase [Spirochaetales bacterium]|nr:DNA (cytosine-5-)-methyltransferase [Spirochaetales bacterium]
MKEIKVLSLFSGAGGLDLGFTGNFNYRNKKYDKNRFKIVYSNDFDNAACSTYNENKRFFGHKIINKDVAEINESEIPSFDFLIGGFPCQPFSNAGLRKGINDSRGTLFEHAIRLFKSQITDGSKPLGFMFENVRGILSSKMPNGISVPEHIVEVMEELGYSTSYELVKASNYGVPSNRYRVFIIGLRKDLGYFNFNELNNVVKKHNLPSCKTDDYELKLGSILCDIPNNTPQLNDYWEYSPSSQMMVENIGPCVDGEEALVKFKNKIPIEEISETISIGRSWKNMPYDKMTDRFKKIWDDPKKYRAPNFYRRFALGEINGTITASAQPENCGITHPFENRRFSIREIARIQSFPDDFIFNFTNIANAYKVIGNAVPPILGWVMANAIQEHLEI